MILLQDIKERKVYWFLFPTVGLCAGILFHQNTWDQLFYTSVSINFSFVSILLLTILIYSKLKLKTSISKTFGLGDGMLFLALIFSFPSVTFIVFLVFGLIFSLLLHLFLKKKSEHQTVPLAGYLSLFFTVAYLAYWSGFLKSVYTI
ncbi:hypothetical protein [Winogradskyella undariae]|uniref:hypothetical protein n=1 Tax=Winogradskyella undariae TaxID=1285465 RepID=UPI001C2B7FBB|nr:hypothetical protein [Winogradskyella undariae]